jgi:hypothetical protein
MKYLFTLLLMVPIACFAADTVDTAKTWVDYLFNGFGLIISAFIGKLGEWLFQKLFSNGSEAGLQKSISDSLLIALLKIAYWLAIAGLITAIAGFLITFMPNGSYLHSIFYGAQHLTWAFVNIVVIIISAKTIYSYRI